MIIDGDWHIFVCLFCVISTTLDKNAVNICSVETEAEFKNNVPPFLNLFFLNDFLSCWRSSLKNWCQLASLVVTGVMQKLLNGSGGRMRHGPTCGTDLGIYHIPLPCQPKK